MVASVTVKYAVAYTENFEIKNVKRLNNLILIFFQTISCSFFIWTTMPTKNYVSSEEGCIE